MPLPIRRIGGRLSERLAEGLRKVGGPRKIDRAFSTDEVNDAMHRTLRRKAATLETRLEEAAGPGAVEGRTLSVQQALDAAQKDSTKTHVEPGTDRPTEYSKTHGNAVSFAPRLVAPDLRLSATTYAQLPAWCLAATARPLSRKHEKPITLTRVRNCLRVIRALVEWAGRHYGWRRPDRWREATMVRIRRTK